MVAELRLGITAPEWGSFFTTFITWLIFIVTTYCVTSIWNFNRLGTGIKGGSIPASQAFCAEGEGFFEIVKLERIDVYIMKSALWARCLPGQILREGK